MAWVTSSTLQTLDSQCDLCPPLGFNGGHTFLLTFCKLRMVPKTLAVPTCDRMSVPYRQVTRFRLLCSARSPGSLRSSLLHLALQRGQEPLEELASEGTVSPSNTLSPSVSPQKENWNLTRLARRIQLSFSKSN